ncbi:MAG: HAD family hydrolase [Erysipelotrichaceae bacterium]
MIKMVVSDMDGTLLHDDKTLNSNIYKYVDYFINNNIKFVLASGRQIYNLESYFLDYLQDIAFIGENGGNLKDNNKTIYTNYISKTDCLDILKQIEGINTFDAILCANDSAYISNNDPKLLEEVKRYYSKVKLVNDLKELDVDVFKIAIHDNIDASTNSNSIIELHSSNLIKCVSAKEYLDIMPSNTNKGAALKMLCNKYSIKEDEILCFGDYLNDIEMLSCAKYSYALANSVNEVKKVANYLTSSNNDDGVLKVLSEYFNIIE